MSTEQILDTVRGFDGVLELAPTADSGHPEIAWGDHFFYYAPDGVIPRREQPFATVVSKNYPGDTRSGLDRPGRRRLNIHVGRARFLELLGEEPRAAGASWDFGAADTVVPHPVYRAQGWVAIVDPGDDTTAIAVELLRGAYDDACRRAARRR